jgi:hypothetical protein
MIPRCSRCQERYEDEPGQLCYRCQRDEIRELSDKLYATAARFSVSIDEVRYALHDALAEQHGRILGGPSGVLKVTTPRRYLVADLLATLINSGMFGEGDP